MKHVFLAVALILLAGAGQGQPPQPTAAGADTAAIARHRQDELRDMSTVLGLKPSQQPALQAWLAAQHPPEGLWRHGPHDAGQPPRTTPEMLQEKQDRMARIQRFEAGKLAATKQFYVSLDSRQQQVFDALARLRHETDAHHHGWHGHGGHHMDTPGAPPPPTGGA